MSAEKKATIISGNRFRFTPDCHPPTFWKSVITGEPYRVRAMWIVGSNPLMTATQGLTIERALKDYMEYTVVSDLFMTPTAQLADLVLPAAHWLEQDDVVFMHEVWCVMTRKKLAQIGEARDDRDVILEVAHRLGLNDAFPWPDRYAYLDWLCEGTGMRFEEFREKDSVMGEMRYRKHEEHGFRTPSRKFEFYSTVMERAGRPPLPVYVEPPLSPVSDARARAGISLHPHDGHKGIILFPFGAAPDRFPAQAPPRSPRRDQPRNGSPSRHIGRGLGIGRIALCKGQAQGKALRRHRARRRQRRACMVVSGGGPAGLSLEGIVRQPALRGQPLRPGYRGGAAEVLPLQGVQDLRAGGATMKDALFVVFLTNRSSGLAAAPRNFPLITLSLGNHQLFVIDDLHISR